MGTKGPDNATAAAVLQVLQSPNVSDSNGEVANIVDTTHHLAVSTHEIARAILASAMPGTDATGGHVECVVEAMMGMTAGLVRIADAIGDLAEAVRESKP